ncbi:MAG: thioredoxin family protein [Gammaproteobacteria bacterium]|nr:MAG: thioredoxin family protein [Gammaproteobacteria bacterium]
MRYFYVLLLSGLIFFQSSSFASEKTIKPKDLPSYSKIYDEQSDPFKDAMAAIALAKHTQRNVLIEIGGDWCTWCHKMDAFLEKNQRVYQALHSKFVLLKVNVSDTNKNKDFMDGMPPVLGYPHMYVSTGNGKMILSKDTAELQVNGQYNVKTWLDFLVKWQVKTKPTTTNLVAQQ